MEWSLQLVINDMVESLWVWIEGQGTKVGITAGVYYKPLSLDYDTNSLFLILLRSVSRTALLVNGLPASQKLRAVPGSDLLRLT